MYYRPWYDSATEPFLRFCPLAVHLKFPCRPKNIFLIEYHYRRGVCKTVDTSHYKQGQLWLFLFWIFVPRRFYICKTLVELNRDLKNLWCHHKWNPISIFSGQHYKEVMCMHRWAVLTGRNGHHIIMNISCVLSSILLDSSCGLVNPACQASSSVLMIYNTDVEPISILREVTASIH